MVWPNRVVFEVNFEDGSDDNGGGYLGGYGGTDRSYPTSSPQLLNSPALVGNILSDGGYTFTAADAGNVVSLTDGVSRVRYLITYVDGGGQATLHDTPTITPTSGVVGGALQTIVEGFKALQVSGYLYVKRKPLGASHLIDEVIYPKVARWPSNDPIVSVASGTNSLPSIVEGYESTRGDGGLGTSRLEFDPSIVTNWTVGIAPDNSAQARVCYKFLELQTNSLTYGGHGFFGGDSDLAYRCRILNARSWAVVGRVLECVAEIEAGNPAGGGFTTGQHHSSLAINCNTGFSNSYEGLGCVALNCTGSGFSPNVRAFTHSVAIGCTYGLNTTSGLHSDRISDRCVLINNTWATYQGRNPYGFWLGPNGRYEGGATEKLDPSTPDMVQLDADPFIDSANLDLRLTVAAKSSQHAAGLKSIMSVVQRVPLVTVDSIEELTGAAPVIAHPLAIN